jgi:hypothetical protein
MLESETIRRMAACFARQTCCKCGGVAVRLAHRRFYCDRHFPGVKEAAEAPKVYRCLVSDVQREREPALA